MKQPERLSSQYAMEIPLKDFMRILKQDTYQYSDTESKGITLSEDIDKLDGVDDADYNGHFGNYIYYRVETKHDTPETHKKIQELTQAYIDAELPDVYK